MKKALLLFLSLLGLLRVNAQIESRPTYAQKSAFDWSKLEYGGNLSLELGDYTHIGIAPQIGYKVSPYASLGVTMGYNYYSDKYDYNNKDEFSAVTMGLYARLYPIQQIVFSVQPEISRVWISGKSGGYSYSDTGVAPTCLIGAGVRYSGVIFMLQYDVVQDKYTPYGGGLVYSAGFCF